jgi:hypothetical protein
VACEDEEVYSIRILSGGGAFVLERAPIQLWFGVNSWDFITLSQQRCRNRVSCRISTDAGS